MHLRIDVYHHMNDEAERATRTILDQILAHVEALRGQGSQIMGKQDELEAELVAANETTNEIAADLDDLLARLAGGLSPTEADAVKAQIIALKDRLTGVAAKHTPTT